MLTPSDLARHGGSALMPELLEQLQVRRVAMRKRATCSA